MTTLEQEKALAKALREIQFQWDYLEPYRDRARHLAEQLRDGPILVTLMELYRDFGYLSHSLERLEKKGHFVAEEEPDNLEQFRKEAAVEQGEGDKVPIGPGKLPKLKPYVRFTKEETRRMKEAEDG